MKILKISRKNLEKTIKIVAKVIQGGKVLICPTDTVYGLIADAANKKAVAKIFQIKKRPKRKPLPLFVKDLKMAKKLVKISKEQEKTLKEVWFTRPNFTKGKTWAGTGKYTFVLPRKKGTKIYGIDRKTIALRIPKYKFLNDLLKKVNRPLVQTSANLSGQPVSNKISQIISQFESQKNQPNLILDVGNLPKSKPSKVIDLTRKTPKILRY